MRGPQQAIDQRAQLGAAVDAILCLGKVARPILLEVEMLVGASDRRLEVSNERVDPFEDLQIAGLTWADDDGAVLGHDRPGGAEARPTVGDQVNCFVQRRARSVRHRRAFEIRNRVEPQMQRMPLVVELNSSDERNLVLRSPPRLTGMHTAEVGVVGQKTEDPGEQAVRFALSHGREQLVLDPPGGTVAHPQMPLEREGGDVALALGDQINRLEPFDQGRLGGVKQGSGAHRRLRSTVRALPVLAPVGQKRAVRRPAARRAAESRWPACPLQGGLAMRLGSKPLDELAQWHTRLKLNLVLGHRRILVRGYDEDFAPSTGSDCEPLS